MAESEKRPRGRPRAPEGEGRDAQIRIRLKPAELEKLRLAADKASKTLSEWARDKLLRGT